VFPQQNKKTNIQNTNRAINESSLTVTASSYEISSMHLTSTSTMMWFAGGILLMVTLLFSSLHTAQSCEYPCVPGSENIMKPKEHGTSHTAVQENLRWECDWDTADRICNYNRHYAEYAGYWEKTTFKESVEEKKEEYFYDSNTGKNLFRAPVDRTWNDWMEESSMHGWPSFRDNEVNWDNVRVLPDGETVSVDGTHLGHNIPDGEGNRYCINLVSIAGNLESN
jgi:peptide methionine sulfoxide reductase MsrB